MNINEIIHDEIAVYENFYYEIESIFFDNALEAEENVDDAQTKTSFALKLKEKVIALFKNLEAIIERFAFNISNYIKRALQTNRGFKESYMKAYKSNKPLTGIKLITYNYDTAFLETQYTKISNSVVKIITSYENNYSKNTDDAEANRLLNQSPDEMIIDMLKNAGCPNNVTNINLYFKFLKENFRREKKEQLFVASKAKEYVEYTGNYEKVESTIHNQTQMINSRVKTMKGKLLNVVSNQQMPNEIKQRAIRLTANCTQLLNFYTTFLKIYYQLFCERSISYREVLKRLYHF